MRDITGRNITFGGRFFAGGRLAESMTNGRFGIRKELRGSVHRTLMD